MAEAQSRGRLPQSKRQPKRKKLPQLPQNATISKRPLHRPALHSPYTNSSQQKVVYISAKTPFLSAVKRVEKLLDLADKRLTQAATTNAKQPGGRGGPGGGNRQRKRGAQGDEILGIAEEVEKLKGGGKRRKGAGDGVVGVREEGEDGDGDGNGGVGGEEVVLKGTGKAIQRVLELALWFQQREEVFAVRLKTGSVGAIDDVAVEEEGQGKEGQKGDAGDGEDVVGGAGEGAGDAVEVDERDTTGTAGHRPAAGGEDRSTAKKRKKKRTKETLGSDEVPETRIRYTSVLEAYVSLI